MRVFVDTGGWIAIVSADDQHHQVATEQFEGLLARRARVVTSDFVIDEAVTRIGYDVGHRAAIGLLDLFRDAEGKGSLDVQRVTPTVWEAAEGIFRKYDDQVFSFTDCTSFVLARQESVDLVFGFDHDFLLFGFEVVPRL